MPHKSKRTKKSIYKEMLSDLVIQRKMNEKFIKELPNINRRMFLYTIEDPITAEFSVLGTGFVPEKRGFKAIKPF